MQALILAGGEGTRLRPLTETVPKPIVPLVGRPLITYMIDWLAGHGVEEVVLACGFLADDVRGVLGEGAPAGPRLRYVEEPEPLGTAGGIKFAEDLLEDRFLALNGDVLTDLDLTALIRFHEEREAPVTLGLHPVEDPTGYGLVDRDDQGKVLSFNEKPEPGSDSGEINAGTYVLERSVLDLIPEGRAVSIERDIFPRLVGRGLHGLRLEGYWMDIGTPDRYLGASWDILERRVRTEVGEKLDEAGRLVDEGAEVEKGAEVGGAVMIDAGARVATGATVGPRAVIGPGCEIAERATVAESVLHRDCAIGGGSVVRGAILAAGVQIGPGVEVPPGSTIGAGERVAA